MTDHDELLRLAVAHWRELGVALAALVALWLMPDRPQPTSPPKAAEPPPGHLPPAATPPAAMLPASPPVESLPRPCVRPSVTTPPAFRVVATHRGSSALCFTCGKTAIPGVPHAH